MVGQLGCQRLVRYVIRVSSGSDKFRSQLPDRVVAGQEDDAPLLQQRDGVAVRPEYAFWVLALHESSRSRLEKGRCVGLELGARERGKFVLVPQRLIEQ